MKRFLSILIAVTMLCGVAATANTNAEESTMVISDFTVETMHEPLGLSPVLAPRFAWKLESAQRGQGQTAYAITVGTAENGDDMWSTGWVNSTAQNAEYAGVSLADSTKYFVSLKVKDINGAVCEKATTFETGIREENWEDSLWIGWGDAKRLRKVVTVAAGLKQARAYIAGLGYYELSINGEKIGESVLESPAGKDRVRYATFDVTENLKQGENAIGIMLGAAYEHNSQRRARMILNLTYENGTTETVVTDKTWSSSNKSEVVSDSIYNGEVYDARIDDGWKMADYTETSDWNKAKDTNSKFTYENGKLYLDSTCGEFLYTDGEALTNYTIEADVTTSTVVGLAFNGVDKNNYCMWQIRNGKVNPHIKQNGSFTSESVAFTSLGTNHVKIDISGTSVKTYVNGNLIHEKTVPFASGTVGFRQAANESGTVENYKVTDSQGNVLYTTEDVLKWGGYIAPPIMDAQVQDVRIMKAHAPVSIDDRGDGVYIVDAGDNATGWLALKNLNGTAGDTITMRYAEMLYEDGSLDATSMRHSTQNKYTLSGKAGEGYTPKFFFTTFRYVEITGFPGVPTLDNFEIHRVYSNMPTIGEFTSSSKLLNDISDAYIRTQTSCMLSVPMDSAQREKHGWLGDAHVTGEAAHYYLDAAIFYDKWMYDIADQMVRAGSNGFVNLQVPDYGDGTGPNSGYKGGDICWTFAVFSIPWDTYRATGDITYLSRHYETMKAHLGWWINKGKPNTMHWDWVGIDKSKVSAQMMADAYYCRSIELMRNIAAELGKTEDAETYSALYEQKKTEFNTSWYKDGYYDTNTQCANSTALAFGLVEEENVEAVIKNIEKNLFIQNTGHLTTGVMGTKNIMDAMIAYNRPDIAYRINRETTYPSLGYMIESGATTLWEYWQHIHCDENTELYPGQYMPTISSAWMSQSHCFLGGGFGTWVFRGLAGVSPKTPGYETVKIAPQLPLDLKEASAKVNTVRGEVYSGWKRDAENNLTLEVSIPTGSTGEVFVPIRGALKNVTVKESGTTLYSGGSITDTEHIEFVSATEEYVAFNVASGDYTFTMTGEGMYPYEEEKSYELVADTTALGYEKTVGVPVLEEDFTGNEYDTSVFTNRSLNAEYLTGDAVTKNTNSMWYGLHMNGKYGANTEVSAKIKVVDEGKTTAYLGQYIGMRLDNNKVISETSKGIWVGATPTGGICIGSDQVQNKNIIVPSAVDFAELNQLVLSDIGDKIIVRGGENKTLLAVIVIGETEITVYDAKGTEQGTITTSVSDEGVIGFCNWGVTAVMDDICVSKVSAVRLYAESVAPEKLKGQLREGEMIVSVTPVEQGVVVYQHYDKNDNLKEQVEVTESMDIPASIEAEDYIKVFVWDNAESQNIISGTLTVACPALTVIELPEGSELVETADIKNSASDSKWAVNGATLEVNPYGIDGYAYTVAAANKSVSYNFENKLGANSVATLKFYSPIIGHNTRFGFKYVDDSGEHTVQIGGNVAKTIPSNQAYILCFDHNVNRYYSTGTGVTQSVGWHEFAVIADENGTLTFYIDGTRILANGAEFSKSLGENGYISGIQADVPGWFTSTDGAEYLQGAITDIRLFDVNEPVLRGDADGDGKVTVYDAVNMLKITAGVVNADNKVTKAADVDGDGKIGVSDATAVLRYIARITDKL